MMHGWEKSDSAVVAVKLANNAERSTAEPVEPRVETEGNAGQQSTHRTQSRVRVSQALDRIREVFAVRTRGKSRMRESCTYGSVRGGREVTHVPTATGASSSCFWVARRQRGRSRRARSSQRCRWSGSSTPEWPIPRPTV